MTAEEERRKRNKGNKTGTDPYRSGSDLSITGSTGNKGNTAGGVGT